MHLGRFVGTLDAGMPRESAPGSEAPPGGKK